MMDEGGGVREEGLGSWGEGVEVREVGAGGGVREFG